MRGLPFSEGKWRKNGSVGGEVGTLCKDEDKMLKEINIEGEKIDSCLRLSEDSILAGLSLSL